jgi:hypothetical protein
LYKIDHCPACHSKNIHLSPSKLSKFVVWRITGVKVEDPVDNNGILCYSCDFLGSQLRFTEEESQRLYSDYRGDLYNAMRIECEPHYANRLLEFSDPAYIEGRKQGLDRLIAKNIEISSVHQILDFGGDTGIFIPDYFVNSEKFVYDISGVNLLPGVQSFDPTNFNRSIDFLMCCHVLEHSSDPDTILTEIKKFIDKNSWIYFEVPNNPYLTLPKAFHEHINIFNISSLTSLLIRNGFAIIDSYESKNLSVLSKLVSE